MTNNSDSTEEIVDELSDVIDRLEALPVSEELNDIIFDLHAIITKLEENNDSIEVEVVRTKHSDVKDLLFGDYEHKATFVVKGSTGTLYNVDFIRRGESLTAFCDCKAGRSRNQCKHRIDLLTGNKKNLVEGEEQFHKLKELLVGTDVQQALQDLLEAESKAPVFKTKVQAREYRTKYTQALADAFNS